MYDNSHLSQHIRFGVHVIALSCRAPANAHINHAHTKCVCIDEPSDRNLAARLSLRFILSFITSRPGFLALLDTSASGAVTGFLERGFIYITVGGFALPILSHYS